MTARRKTSIFKLIPFSVIALSAITADASVISLCPPLGACSPVTISSTPITFTGLAQGTEVNGLSVGGVLFSYSLGDGNVEIDTGLDGSGPTNRIAPPNILGDSSGVLTLALPGFFNTFGYGYALLTVTTPIPNATTISLFSGATNVGTISSYTAFQDPVFMGGFAGIQSTIPFDTVTLSFEHVLSPAFELDNIQFGNVVPEPSTVLLMLSGAAGLFWGMRRRVS